MPALRLRFTPLPPPPVSVVPPRVLDFSLSINPDPKSLRPWDATKCAAFYINLEARKDRRAAMERELAAHGVPAQRIEATAGRQRHHKLNAGQLGCTLSHRRTWQAFLETDAAFALVLEDDITIMVPDFVARLHKLLQAEAPPPDLIYLSRNFFGLRHQGFFDGPAAALPDTYVPECIGGGTHAYLVSRGGAAKLLDVAEDGLFAAPLDLLLPTISGLCYCSTREFWLKARDFGDSDTG